MQNNSKIFHNVDAKIKPKGFLDFLKWRVTSTKPKWPEIVPIGGTDVPPARVDDHRVCISFVGHVTFLIQTNGLNILTDPVWSERASPLTFVGPKRVTPPGIKFDDLPPIDVLLISHNHYDHMDIPTIKKLWERDKPQIITPLMNDRIIESHIPDIEVITMNWADKISIEDNIDIYLEPAQHWSARGLFDLNKALWGTFIITTASDSICFIGDSGYNPEIFKKIGNKYDISISLIPIGAFEPRWFMKDIHMNPEEAILTHKDLKSKYSIASHFETFQLADDAFRQAAIELDQARHKYAISNRTFITPKIGSIYWFIPDKSQQLAVSAFNF